MDYQGLRKRLALVVQAVELAELVASVGGSKGEEIDKFQRFGIATEPPTKTTVPILKDAYAAYECGLFNLTMKQ